LNCVALAYAIKPAASNCQVSKNYFVVIHYGMGGWEKSMYKIISSQHILTAYSLKAAVYKICWSNPD